MKILAFARKLIRRILKIISIFVIIILANNVLARPFNYFSKMVGDNDILSILISLLFLINILIISILVTNLWEKMEYRAKHLYRRYMILGMLSSIVLIVLVNDSSNFVQDFFLRGVEHYRFPLTDVELILLFFVLLWINLTYILISKNVLLLNSYKINKKLYIYIAIVAALIFILLINPITFSMFSIEIKIILMLLNVGLLFILLIYDFLLESWFIEIFKKELETANFIKCNFLYKYLLMNFYIDSDYFPDRVYKKDIKHYFERADVGDCSFVLSENERYSLDFSFDNILYKKDGQLSGHFYLQKKYEHLETHRFDGL